MDTQRSDQPEPGDSADAGAGPNTSDPTVPIDRTPDVEESEAHPS